jgi:hypothetical protein
VMLVNISPAAALERPTLNSLRYGQVVTAASAPKNKRAGVRKPAGKPPAKSAGPCEPVVLEALRKIYAQHVPEKTAEEVEAILGKFAGREVELLGKVRAKYGK